MTEKAVEVVSNSINIDALLDQGWRHLDVPWGTQFTWTTLMEAIGDDHVVPIAMNIQRGVDRCRGQILVSPEGILNIFAMLKRIDMARAEGWTEIDLPLLPTGLIDAMLADIGVDHVILLQRVRHSDGDEVNLLVSQQGVGNLAAAADTMDERLNTRRG